tara:strand:+ start:31 stop:1305 length:1275 start_codon:yes stop_codon:yes gene_type:complete
MKIELVNHACYIVDTGSIRILCDPWLSGHIFDRGWRLLKDSNTNINDLEYDYIWISHEHPDHFHTPTLNEIKGPKTFFYQETKDKKVKNWLEKKGHKVIEMEDWKPFNLPDNSKLTVTKVSDDSWMSVKKGDELLLNLNDCVVNTKEQCKEIITNIGIPLVLMTQFSFSSWIGNEGDGYWNRKCADNVLERVKLQTEELLPNYVIPFASFVKFAHRDNDWMNNYSNKIEDVIPYIEPTATAIPMYLGQRWNIGDEPPEDMSFLWYTNDDIHVKTWDKDIPFREILTEFEYYQKNIKKQNSWLAIRLLKWCGLLPTTTIYLEDNNIGINFCIVDGIKPSRTHKDDCDVSMKAETFINVLRYEWGRGTLTVNGRFKANYDKMWRFFRQTKIAYANNVGKKVPLTLSLRELLSKYKPFGEKLWKYTT